MLNKMFHGFLNNGYMVGVYVGKVTRPPAGYTAFFIELAFPSDLSIPHKLSTQVRVIPDTRPFAGIDPKTAKLEGT